MRTNYPRLVSAAAALVATATALTAATPVFARSEVSSMTVSHAGLDLSSPEGRRTFERRIAYATKRVCAFENNRNLATEMRQRRCMADSRKRSGEQVAALFARHDRVKLAQMGTVDATPAR